MNQSGLQRRRVDPVTPAFDAVGSDLLLGALQALSSDMARLEGSDFFRAVSRHLCEALGLDLAFVGRLEPDALRVQVVDGWMDGAALSPFAYDLDGTPCADVLDSSYAIHPSEVQSLFPRDEALVQMGLHSYIGGPLYDKRGQPLGVLVGLGRSPLAPDRVPLAAPLLDLFADRVAAELLRLHAEQAMRTQLALQRLVAQTSSALMAGLNDAPTFAAALDHCLARLGPLLQADRCHVFERVDDSMLIRHTHEWCAPGVPAQFVAGVGRDFMLTDLPWWWQRIQQGVVHIPAVAALPPEAQAERAAFAASGIKALLTLALSDERGQLTGCLGLDQTQAMRAWSEADIALLRLLADTIGTALQRQRDQVQLKLAASVFDHASEGIIVTDPQGQILDVNGAFERVSGYTRAEALGRNPRFLQSGRHDAAFYGALWRDLQTHGHWQGEVWNQRKTGEVYAQRLAISAVQDAHGRTERYVGLLTDITALKNHQTQLEFMAHYDALTGLPNRTLLADRLKLCLAQTQRREARMAVAYLDLDGFKEVNDTHGHAVGDRLLVLLAERMKRVMREGDTLARIGGDEFVAVFVDLHNPCDCYALLNRLLEAAARPVRDGAALLQVSASVGVTLYPQGDEPLDAEQLLRQADQAMYQAKLSGKNRYHLFDAELDRGLRGQHQSLARMREALNANEFVLHYQPKVHLRSGMVVGLEALVRWQDPDLGLRPPADFLPLLANQPLMVELGDWVIEAALQQMAAWRAQGLELPVSVNVDALQFAQPDFTDKLRAALARYPQVAGHALELEVLETSALDDVNQVVKTMQGCAALGVRVALDDFGTGYSSLTYLKRLPAQVLKIDRSFVRDMLDDPDDLAILEGVLGLARVFQRQVIAEGVETLVHGQMLLRMGCEWGQGYAIAKPMPADRVAPWLHDWRVPPLWAATRQLDHADQDLLFAIVEHRAWARHMRSYLEGENCDLPPMQADDCRLSHWLRGSGAERYAQHPALARVWQLHEALHQCALDLLEARRLGALVLAPAYLQALDGLSLDLLQTLARLVDGADVTDMADGVRAA